MQFNCQVKRELCQEEEKHCKVMSIVDPFCSSLRILGNEASSIRGKDFDGKEELLLALSSLLLVPNLGGLPL